MFPKLDLFPSSDGKVGETPAGQDPLQGGRSVKWAAIQCHDGYISRFQ
jgi:hypothetical protein